MADRIFPASIRESLGDKKEINQINADFLKSRLAAIESGEAQAASKASEDVLAMLREIEASTGEAEAAATPTTAKRAIPEAFKEHQFKKKDAPESAPEEECDDMEREGGDEPKTASASARTARTARTRKVFFSSPDMIDAAAVRMAAKQGDEPLKEAILQARDDRRGRLFSRILAETQEIMEREASLSKRQSYRMSIIESTEAAKNVVAAAQSTGGKAMNASKVTPATAKPVVAGYKKVGKLTVAEKSAFAQIAEAQGFPAEYVASLLGSAATVSSTEQEIREVMSSALPVSTKKAALTGLVRTAKLSPEQLNRARDYWKNDLGYGDVEWIDDLFTSKFDN